MEDGGPAGGWRSGGGRTDGRRTGDDGDSPFSRQENGALSILVVIHRHIIISTPSTPTTKDDYWIAVDRQTYSNRF